MEVAIKKLKCDKDGRKKTNSPNREKELLF